ncbi:ComEA family DNA-binding protein [Staphylococcus sp. 18_1_E_LY]|uniref:ComEA family DNA-binding protein n=1 Tax=Staphylococcus lloydii TaxID=2781774 RepID=A0A7T1AXM3_9STAP|nr:ComEA family DNA-binding protein [Staphylococcus lloydii]MBF7018556.1 ComEA family DNA-binding protein [Staphylococcus lloydii]MBF7026284.1 ComEA family DNA-binding protein [Staphylococcus lloydii]QPM73961.1 ComEA family DNA-binding protein [Staphylococcus lloydii]
MSYWLAQLRSLILKKRNLILISFFVGMAIVILAFSSFGKTDSSHFSKVEMGHQSDNVKDHTFSSAKVNTKIKQPDNIYVDIKGAVKYPNVYQMKSTDRVKQLLEKAQPTDDAELSTVNLAEKLLDQKLVIIPNKNDKVNALNTNLTSAHQMPNKISKSPVNLNTATVDELKTINGIGESKAQAIINYREQHGSFDSIEKLKEVKGIGTKTFEKLQAEFTI